LEVAFLRENPMQGNFYEAVWNALQHVCSGVRPDVMIFISLTTLTVIILIIQLRNQYKQTKI